MIINGKTLLGLKPIKNMLSHKVSALPTSYGLSEIGYDIRVKQDIHFWLDPSGHPMVSVNGVIKPGRFCLASSVEEFQMPNSLGAIGHDKSTNARLGVQVFNTVIEPGWNGFLTLELVFNAEQPVHIPAGSGIMQVIFHSLAHNAVYDGKYRDQADEPIPAKTGP